MGERWQRNHQALLDYASGAIHLAQLYNAIESRAAGKWVDKEDEEGRPDDDFYADDDD
jgi:hypothetical protein